MNGYERVKSGCLGQGLLTLEYDFVKVAVRFVPVGCVIKRSGNWNFS